MQSTDHGWGHGLIRGITGAPRDSDYFPFAGVPGRCSDHEKKTGVLSFFSPCFFRLYGYVWDFSILRYKLGPVISVLIRHVRERDIYIPTWE